MAYQINPEHVTAAFNSGQVEAGSGKISFMVASIGSLRITSGQLAGSDPFVETNPPPFTQAVPNGIFPVDLAIRKYQGSDERVAFARILFSKSRVASWHMALVKGDDMRNLHNDDYFGYGVDAGTGCFMDAGIAEAYSKKVVEDEQYFERLSTEMGRTYRHTWSWLSFKPDEHRDENVICFSSGLGDGCYPTFIGKDSRQNVVAVITDFMTIAGEDQDIILNPTPAPWWKFW